MLSVLDSCLAYDSPADDWAKVDENGSSGSGDDGGGGSRDEDEDDEDMEMSATEAIKPKKKVVNDTKKVVKKSHFNIVFIGHVGQYALWS